MKKNTIEYLAYLLDKAKRENSEKAIVFLGAGASVSAGIPLTYVIIRHIRLKFIKNPLVKELLKEGKDDYISLMGVLTADERRDLFHFYVTRNKVKLNMANVYLAQLLKEGYVDYIVTVNFDDLILKACSLFNFLPPVYDVSNIKTITTTDIRTKSVLYLHGQYFGQWLLNNKEELKKVESEVLSLFNTIKTRRTWIVVGYSGKDGVFDKIKSLGSFSNEFFWVKKALHKEEDKHVINFIETPNNNVHALEGHYADTFFLKLHAELSNLNNKLNPPDIFYKPFTHIKSIMQNVNGINSDDDLSEQVKNIIDVCNDRVDKAIGQFENEETIEDFKQEIIDAILKKDYTEQKVIDFEDKIKTKNFMKANIQLSWYTNNYGIEIAKKAFENSSGELYEKSFIQYKKSLILNSNNINAHSNYGIALTSLGKMNSDELKYKEGFIQFEKAIKLSPSNSKTYNNYGIELNNLANLNLDIELYEKSFSQFEKAIELNPDFYQAYDSYGRALSDLAKQKSNDNLYEKSFVQFEKGIKSNPNYAILFGNYANALSNMGEKNSNEQLYTKSFNNYEKAIKLDPDKSIHYVNYALSLSELAILKKDKQLFEKAHDSYMKTIELTPKNSSILDSLVTNLLFYTRILEDPEKKNILLLANRKAKETFDMSEKSYNLSCTYSLLNKKNDALKYLQITLDNKQFPKNEIIKDEDWKDYLEDPDFIELLAKY